MARKRAEQTTNYWIVLTIDTDGCVVRKAFEPRSWPFDVTDVTGDVQGAVHLLQMGALVKCVNDDAFLDEVRREYGEVRESQ